MRSFRSIGAGKGLGGLVRVLNGRDVEEKVSLRMDTTNSEGIFGALIEFERSVIFEAKKEALLGGKQEGAKRNPHLSRGSAIACSHAFSLPNALKSNGYLSNSKRIENIRWVLISSPFMGTDLAAHHAYCPAWRTSF